MGCGQFLLNIHQLVLSLFAPWIKSQGRPKVLDCLWQSVHSLSEVTQLLCQNDWNMPWM